MKCFGSSPETYPVTLGLLQHAPGGDYVVQPRLCQALHWATICPSSSMQLSCYFRTGLVDFTDIWMTNVSFGGMTMLAKEVQKSGKVSSEGICHPGAKVGG